MLVMDAVEAGWVAGLCCAWRRCIVYRELNIRAHLGFVLRTWKWKMQVDISSSSEQAEE